MPALLGSGPWRIPPTTTAQERRDALQNLAVAGERDPGIQAVAARIRRAVDAAACCDPRRVLAARAQAALDFVHGLPWRDEGPTEVYQSVGRTLRVGGNCHDFSPVLVALLRALGIPSAKVVWLNQDGAPLNHVLVQLVAPSTGGWCWAETTVDGATICEDPYAAERRLDGTRHAMGVAIPAGVHAPAATGQDVATSTVGPSAPAPADETKRSGPLVPALRAPTLATQAALPAARGPVATAPLAPKPSAGLATDPCDAAWQIVARARAAFGVRLVYPATGAYGLRRRDGAAMPQPTGAPMPWTGAQWTGLPIASAAGDLESAVNGWAAGRGIDPAAIDGGSMFDWLNVATYALYTQTDALRAAESQALAAYVACRRAGKIDAAAVLRGSNCGDWSAVGQDFRRAVVRGYLAGNGYAAALDDATVDALAATVTRACAARAVRKQIGSTTPRAGVALLIRRR